MASPLADGPPLSILTSVFFFLKVRQAKMREGGGGDSFACKPLMFNIDKETCGWPATSFLCLSSPHSVCVCVLQQCFSKWAMGGLRKIQEKIRKKMQIH